MNIIAAFRSQIRPATAARTVILAAVIGLEALTAYAAQSNMQFNVVVRQTIGDTANLGLCRNSTKIGSFGEAMTVMCSSGTTVDFTGDTSSLPWIATQDGAFRFVTIASRTGESMGSLGSYRGGGTVTSWRVVNLAHLDYLELMIGW